MTRHESDWLKEAFTTPAGGSRRPVTENLLHVNFSMLPACAKSVLVVSGPDGRHLENMLAKAAMLYPEGRVDALLIPGSEAPKGFSGTVHQLPALPADHADNASMVDALHGRYGVVLFGVSCDIEAVHMLRGPKCHSDILTFASRINVAHAFAVDAGYNVRRMTPHLRLIEPIEVGGRTIEGLGATFPEELQLFYQKASEVPDGTVVEIGSFHGKSTAVFACAMNEGRVVSVDINHRDTFFETLKRNGVGEKIETITMDSGLAAAAFQEQFPGRLIDVLYIDGAHERDYFLTDVVKWTPLLKPGGTLMCHDYLWCSDIIEIVFEKIVRSGDYEQFGSVDYTFYATKKTTGA